MLQTGTNMLLTRLINSLSTPATSVLHDEQRNMLHTDDMTMDWKQVAGSIRWTSNGHIDRRFR